MLCAPTERLAVGLLIGFDIARCLIRRGEVFGPSDSVKTEWPPETRPDVLLCVMFYYRFLQHSCLPFLPLAIEFFFILRIIQLAPVCGASRRHFSTLLDGTFPSRASLCAGIILLSASPISPFVA